ncbi:DNA-binding protein RFX5 [Echinococcus granulosus]|uniref:DNA-binding protein RFX5 n=1 Tax=Echinococcus granulosus TaxID=6210 RepID=W6ULP2_ECHGR|nr:DNA-binding protein RFX5 [Echinococcus granulosus]EUB61963.1 DNA-binding protein RFX5 [Echinococcus granulosus]
MAFYGMQMHTEQDTRTLYGYILTNLEKTVSPEARSRIDALVREFASFKDTEKILCALLLPAEPHGTSAPSLIEDDIAPNGFEVNSLGVGIFGGSGCSSSLHLSNQVEQSQAYTWIMSHLEEDASTCLRKDEVYEDYRAYCEKHNQKTLNTADFGKVMKRAFPNVRPRRLGQRGQSRYCYGGMRKKLEVQAPSLPDLTLELSAPPASNNFRSGSSSVSSTDEQRLCQRGELPLAWLTDEVRTVLGVTGPILADVGRIILDYARTVLGTEFTSLLHFAQHLVSDRYVTAHSRHAFALIAHLANSSANPSATTASSSLSNILLTPSTAAAGAFAEALQKGRVNSAGSTASSSHSQTPPVTTAMVNQMGGAGGGTLPYRTPAITVAGAVPVSAYQISPSSHYPFSLTQFTSTSSSALQTSATKPALPVTPSTDAYPGTPAYLNQRHQQQPYAHSSTDQRRTSFSENPASYLTPVTCTSNYCASTPTTPYPNRGLEASGSYASYGAGGTFVPQTTDPSSSLQTQPPAPPIASGRSPYAAIPYKHPTTQLPIDAPGAHEPTVRVHLGGVSPTKHMNFFSLSSGSQSTGGYETRYQHRATVSSASLPAPGAPVQSNTGYYPSRYSSFNVMSPATPGQASPRLPSTSMGGETAPSGRSSWQTLKRPNVVRPTSSFETDGGDADPFDYDNLPRLGSSPCPPEIPPSSPTEFLSFYSAGNAARRKETQDTTEDLDRTLTNLSPDTSVNVANKGESSQPLHVHISQDYGNEAEVVRKREALHDALLTPSGESSSVKTSPPVTPRARYGRPHSGGNALDPSSSSTNPPAQKRPTPPPDSNAGRIYVEMTAAGQSYSLRAQNRQWRIEIPEYNYRESGLKSHYFQFGYYIPSERRWQTYQRHRSLPPCTLRDAIDIQRENNYISLNHNQDKCRSHVPSVKWNSHKCIPQEPCVVHHFARCYSPSRVYPCGYFEASTRLLQSS